MRFWLTPPCQSPLYTYENPPSIPCCSAEPQAMPHAICRHWTWSECPFPPVSVVFTWWFTWLCLGLNDASWHSVVAIQTRAKGRRPIKSCHIDTFLREEGGPITCTATNLKTEVGTRNAFRMLPYLGIPICNFRCIHLDIRDLWYLNFWPWGSGL